MLNVILGVLIGLLLAVIVMLSVRRYQTSIERIAKRAENLTKEKGEVFTPDENLEDLES